MASAKQPVNVFHRLDLNKADFPHLKPLSLYSRTIICHDAASSPPALPWTPDGPFCDLKINIGNSGASGSRKRRLEDSCLDETYETPLKKGRFALEHFPDFTCVFGSVVVNRINSAGDINPDGSGAGVMPVQTLWTNSSDDAGGQSSNVQLTRPPLGSDGDTSDLGLEFDLDVDKIMCLSPINFEASAESTEDFVLSCQTFYEEQQCPKQDQGQSKGRVGDEAEATSGITTRDEGYVTKCSKTESQIKSRDLTDSGFDGSEHSVTKSYETSPKKSKNFTVSQTMSLVMSTPLAKFGQLRKRLPLLTPSLPPEEKHFSPKVNLHLSPSGGPDFCSHNTKESPRVPLLCSTQNREDQVSNAGSSIHKSIECHELEAEDEEDVLSISQQLINTKIEESSLWERSEASESFETTLPLQVQVKSKVVLINKQQEEAKPPEERKEASASQRKVRREIWRPLVFKKEEDWEKEKRVYMNSVTRHMEDNAGARDGVMDELLHLMNAVANQETRSNGKRWQHPSDLTRRNFQLRNGSRLLSLDEWHNLSFPKHRRFAQVPRVFERSPVL